MFWQPPEVVPCSGVVTVDTGGDYRQAYIEMVAGRQVIHIEPGDPFGWHMVKRWAEVPPSFWRHDGNEIAYRLH